MWRHTGRQILRVLAESQGDLAKRRSFLECQTFEGHTALDYALSHGHAQCIALLQSSGGGA